MEIILNGKSYSLADPVTIMELSQMLQLEPTRVAIEHNRKIVPRSQYSAVMLETGDQVEIVSFIGGG